jgi:hypothetical protein
MALEAAFFSVLTVLIDVGFFSNVYHLVGKVARRVAAGLNGFRGSIGPATNQYVESVAVPLKAGDSNSHQEDPDIGRERARILGSDVAQLVDDAVVVKNLRKVYAGRGSDKEKVAVNSLSFGIPNAYISCFSCYYRSEWSWEDHYCFYPC